MDSSHARKAHDLFHQLQEDIGLDKYTQHLCEREMIQRMAEGLRELADAVQSLQWEVNKLNSKVQSLENKLNMM